MRSPVILLLVQVLWLCSCSVQKRHYRRGFYLETAAGGNHSPHTASKPAALKEKRAGTIACIAPREQPALVFQNLPDEAIACAGRREAGNAAKIKPLSLRAPQLHPARRALYEGVVPSSVAKAAFRLMLIGFGLFCLAFAVSLSMPELVYVTFIILLAALVFALVSLLSAVSARRDKIANTAAWLRIALLALVISVLIICLSILLIILLF